VWEETAGMDCLAKGKLPPGSISAPYFASEAPHHQGTASRKKGSIQKRKGLKIKGVGGTISGEFLYNGRAI